MVIINSRQFRSNQSKYLGMVANGESIILRSRSYGSFKIVPVTEDDTLMSKEEFYRRVDNGIRQLQEGKYTAISNKQELDEFLEAL